MSYLKTISRIASMFAAVTLSAQASASLITNGDFEDGLTGWYQYGDGTVTTVERESGGYAAKIDTEGSAGIQFLYSPFYVPPGNSSIEVSFDYMFNEQDRHKSESLLFGTTDIFASAITLTSGGIFLDILNTELQMYETTSTDGWVTYTATYDVSGYLNTNPNAWLTFALGETKSWFSDVTESYALVDNISVTPTNGSSATVTEPASLFLLALGLAGLRMARKRVSA